MNYDWTGYALLASIVLLWFLIARGPTIIGRKHIRPKVIIPPELEPNAQALPAQDKEARRLASYDPRAQATKTPTRLLYLRKSDELLSATSFAHASSIDVDSLSEVLQLEGSVPYQPLLDILLQEPTYPVPPPSQPAAVDTPPQWVPWKIDVADPRIELPLWEGPLAIFNDLVAEAHRDEVEAVRAAKQRKANCVRQCEERNQHVATLAQNAKEKYERVQQEQQLAFKAAQGAYASDAGAYVAALRAEQKQLRERIGDAQVPGWVGLKARVELALRVMRLPPYVPREWRLRLDDTSGILVIDHRFPDLSAITWTKQVALKAGRSSKPANQKERREASLRLHPALCLRLAAEAARVDHEAQIKAIVVNGWAEYIQRSTGQTKRAYCASLFATREQIAALSLATLDPWEAFAALKGRYAPTLEIAPIAPIVHFDTSDPRFIEAKDVLSNMTEGENLAIMPWDDFEHLCRQLFERAFASTGAEVRVTQASRDQGVDAIVFDPDPLRGGKIIIQAKRYTNTVDVSAVRDLYGAVINEGAVKGILVTTSQFGPDTYSFSKDKPITLIDGSELLGLLEKHGYKFRINLEEAKARL